MIGPIVVGAALLYLIISIAIVRGAIRHARNNGKNVKRWGWGAALVMYLIPFWDWVPTAAMHQYYCARESGFQIYKSLDQWKAENPGELEILVGTDKASKGAVPNWPTEDTPRGSIAHINQRFGVVSKNHLTSKDEGELFLHVWRWEHQLLDKKKSEILARKIDFSTGNGYIGGEPPIKFWLQSDHCSNGQAQNREFAEFIKKFKGAKR